MHAGHQAGLWTTMYGAVAAAAAAFAGLLFVALTVNLPRILPDAAHVARAREALAGLLSLLVLAILVLIPDQGRDALGIELLGVAVILVILSTGATLLAGTGGGLYWLVATVVIYTLRSALDAWALVVEAAETPHR
jgi:modulator of FtsH protease